MLFRGTEVLDYLVVMHSAYLKGKSGAPKLFSAFSHRGNVFIDAHYTEHYGGAHKRYTDYRKNVSFHFLFLSFSGDTYTDISVSKR